MMVEIEGYYSHDIHMINVDAIESVSYSSPRHGTSSDNRTLEVKFRNSQLTIGFLSYIDRGQREYDYIIEAMRASHKQYVNREETK